MKFKKGVALFVASACFLVSANITTFAEETSAEVVDYSDYVVDTTDDNLLGHYDISAEREFQNKSSRNTSMVNTDTDVYKGAWGTASCYYPSTMKVLEELTSLPGAGVAGISLCPWKPSADIAWFQFDKSKTYVYRLDIKDNYPDETPVHLNVSLSNETEATRTWSKEYGAEGFYLTGDYETYGFTFEVSENFNVASNNALTVGFLADNAVGESFSVDTSALGKVYFAEEKAYNITNEKTTEETGLFAGDSASFEAQITNQIGSEGYLDQTITWLVMNEARTEEIAGFTVETDVTTKNATVTVGDSVPSGTYTVIAYSETYDMAMGQDIKVYDNSMFSDHTPTELTDNLLGHYDLSAEREFRSKTQRHNSSVDTDSDVELKEWSNETSTYYPRAMEVVSGLIIPGAGVAGLSFAPWRANPLTEWFKLDKTKNYVFRLDMKDNFLDETPALVNISISNETEATRTWSKEYGAEGFYLTGDYETYGGTFKVHEDFNPDSTNSISVGFLAGNAIGESFAVDTSRKNIYLAEEKVHDIKAEKLSEGPATSENPAILEASVLNQIGSEGYLDQNFIWKIEDLNGTDVTDKMNITYLDGTKKISVVADSELENTTYKAYALSSDYGICRSVEFDSQSDKDIYNIYVDGTNGNDENTGDIENPVKTIAKAIELVRELKVGNYSYQYVINVADGEYYFDKSQNLTAEDSGQAGAPTVIKAINPGKVTFTGAVEIDTSGAKKVTDKEILARMYEDVRDKVYEIDLLEAGFPYEMADEEKHLSGAGSMFHSIEYPEIYLDGTEQMIAQWPNGEGQYSTVDVVVDTVSFRSRYDDYSRWATADDFWIAGYYVTDYGYRRLYVDSVNTERNIITMEDTGVNSDYMGVVTNLSKRYKAMNLLEEIDVPGEWYIDRDTMKLYFYCPDDIKDRSLEITALKQRMFILKDTENFKFSGIEFEKTRDEVIYMTDVSGIEITNCVFEDVLATAIFSTGTESAKTDYNYWQNQKIDGANNCLIENCIFENIGCVAIDITGGNVDTLEGSGNVIRNNIFHRVAQKTRYSTAVKLNGCGNLFEYNNISACPYQAVTSMGNDHIIRNNEIHDVCYETDDCGAIYQGRSALQRGVEIAYNYLHNLNSIEDLPAKHQNGIYWDDGQGGQWAHNNIIKDVRIDIYNAGVDNKFENNVSVNVPKVLYFKNGSVPLHTEDKTITTWQGYIEYPEIYYEKYENLQYILENYTDENLASLTEVTGNLALNSSEVALENLVTASGNVQTDNAEIFIGEDEHDFRISKAVQAELGISNDLNEDFDMDWIGVQSDLTVPAENIGLNYPMADEIIVDGEGIFFTWDYIEGATWYKLLVATDANFDNLVYEKDTVYNHHTASLDDGKYYWKIVGENTSREFAGVSESEVQSFTVGEDFDLTDVLMSVSGTVRTLTAKLTYIGDEEEISEDVYLAVYDSENTLLDVSKKPYDFTKDVATDISFDLAVNANDLYVKMFVWTADNIAEILSKTFVVVE